MNEHQVTDCYLQIGVGLRGDSVGLTDFATDCYLQLRGFLAEAGFAGRSSVARRSVIPGGRGPTGETGSFLHE